MSGTAVAPTIVAPCSDGPDAALLDGSQQVALDAARQAKALVIAGAAGSGKSTVAASIAATAITQWGLDPARVLVIAASRRLASRMAQQVGVQAGRVLAAPIVRTAPAVAFSILRERDTARGRPAPTLIAGPEQDRILAELLAGHLDDGGAYLPLPDGLPLEALALRGFRHELRDLLMRAAERGLTPGGLAALGRDHGRAEWVLGAQLFADYRSDAAFKASTPDVGARLDPAVVVDAAAGALTRWEAEVPGLPRPGFDLIVVDDYQEATAATARLLTVLHGDGARLVLCGDPDSAVQGFRGAVPGLLGTALAAGSGEGAFAAQACVLDRVWRQSPALREVTQQVTARIPTAGTPLTRRAAAASAGGGQGGSGSEGQVESQRLREGEGGQMVQVAIAPGQAQEAAWIARELRAQHLLGGTPWHRMAVITRSTSRLASLRRDLVAASVPVGLLGSDVPMRDEPAIAPLLAALRVCTADNCTADDAGLAAESALDAATAVTLLCSPLGGLDAVGLRRLRRALRTEELSGGGGRASDALLVEALGDPARCATLPDHVRPAPQQVARVLAAGRQAAAIPEATAQTVMWALWAATGLADRWRSRALAGGPAGARADRDLDAVLSMFKAAEVFVDRNPGSQPVAFADYLAGQDLPADSLAATASGVSQVAALTPVGAAGREWDCVVVAGVQDGVWPDLRIRDSLLGSQALVDLLAGRSDSAQGRGAETRADVLADELRAFAVATSRARRRLIVTAVDGEDDSPSVFCDLVGERTVVPPVSPLDLRGLVAQTRSALLSNPDASTSHTQGAATLLAQLAAAGVDGADPASWYGVAPVSSQAPLWGPDSQVPVSPSRLETVSTCPLRWAFEAAGGTPASVMSQSLGTLIHSIAETLPIGSLSALKAALNERWPTLGLQGGWPERRLRANAEHMLERLAGYYTSDAGEVIAVEAPFSVDVGRARLRGIIDRVEKAGSDGQVVVADLKTGSTAPTQGETVTHPQLGAYQVAVERGGLEGQPSGTQTPGTQPTGTRSAALPPGTRCAQARLIYLGTPTKTASLRSQPGITSDAEGKSWASDLIETAADTMAAPTFEARANKLCDFCPVRRSCPLQPEGRKVIA
ncbi:MAG: PD-(D/E)XK nuclease family protein [Cellulomonadaceae bacterium]|jgi:superfamily I DNA/RNA helicase/RecB family exonuclease|nr:PD-(D/E)XK nuclease family protein [Cellulomonadaceae bacterium]